MGLEPIAQLAHRVEDLVDVARRSPGVARPRAGGSAARRHRRDAGPGAGHRRGERAPRPSRSCSGRLGEAVTSLTGAAPRPTRVAPGEPAGPARTALGTPAVRGALPGAALGPEPGPARLPGATRSSPPRRGLLGSARRWRTSGPAPSPRAGGAGAGDRRRAGGGARRRWPWSPRWSCVSAEPVPREPPPEVPPPVGVPHRAGAHGAGAHRAARRLPRDGRRAAPGHRAAARHRPALPRGTSDRRWTRAWTGSTPW